MIKLILMLQLTLLAAVHGGVNLDPSPSPIQTLEPEQRLWQLFNVGSDEELITFFLREVGVKGIEQVILELNGKLTVSDMEKLYDILIKDAQAEPLALRLWEQKEQKARVETVSPCQAEDLRIHLIIKTKHSPTAFWMVLSDGSVWEVDPIHLGGDDPFLQKLLINSMLGNYVRKAEPTQFEIIHFLNCQFLGFMNVKEMGGEVNFEGKDIYFLGMEGFVK